jgi:hypothetical protein
MPICRTCAQLVETGRVLCPYCYAPMTSTRPLSRRVLPMIALGVLLAALIGLVMWLVDICVH